MCQNGALRTKCARLRSRHFEHNDLTFLRIPHLQHLDRQITSLQSHNQGFLLLRKLQAMMILRSGVKHPMRTTTQSHC